MAQTAGRCADGVLGHPMTSPTYVREVIRPAVQRGAEAAGRSPDDVNVTIAVILQISDDPEEARREAAMQIGFYATTRTYRPVLELHGFADRLDPLRRAFVRQDYGSMIDIALPMVEALGIAGTAAQCRDKLAAYEGLADRVILGGAWVGPSEERVAENHRSILEVFAPAR